MLRRFNIVILIVCLYAVPAAAQEIPEIYQPVRPNAMGGAFTSIANDENAIWTNPAGIARIRKARSRKNVDLIKFPNLVVGANKNGKAFYQGIQNSTGSVDAVADSVDDLADKPFWGFLSFAPMTLFKVGTMPMVMGAFSNTTVSARVSDSATSQAETQIISDLGGVLGFGFTNASNRFNIGLQVRSIARSAYEEVLPLSTLADRTQLQKQFTAQSNKSVGLGVDVGMLWTMADFWFPTLGISILNAPLSCKKDYLNPFSKVRETVCGTVYTGKFANPDAVSTVDPTDIRFGMSMTPRLSRDLGMRVAIDLHHLFYSMAGNNYGLDQIPLTKKLHGGVEFFTGNPLLPSPFSVALGASQGYYTVGASARLGFLSLDFTSYGRDISSDDAAVEDRRYVGALSVDF